MKVPEVTDRQYISVSRRRESSKSKLEIFRSPNSSPTRPIVIVPPIKRIKGNEDFAHKKTAAPIIKPLNVEIKKIKTAEKIAKPFAIKSSMETYVYKQNSLLTKLLGDSFAQKRKVAQVEPFKVFDEDQPLDLSVKKKKVVVESAKMPEAKLSKETEEYLKKSKF